MHTLYADSAYMRIFQSVDEKIRAKEKKEPVD